jgi:hypothetical protein
MKNFPTVMQAFALVGSALALSACVWVDVKPQAEKVRMLTAAEVGRCKPLGKVTSTTADTVWIFARPKSSVQEELNRLARNHAGSMGGDTVVPSGPMVEGEQTYGVYRCINP